MYRGTAGVVSSLSSYVDGFETRTVLHIEAHCTGFCGLYSPTQFSSVFQYGNPTNCDTGTKFLVAVIITFNFYRRPVMDSDKSGKIMGL